MVMFQYFDHDSINFLKWDNCIDNSVNGLVYGLSWYLDIVSPNWDAIIKEEQGKYVAVFPVTKTSKFGTWFIKQPIYTHQLGLFHLLEAVGEQDWKMLFDILLSKYKFISRYELNSHNTYPFSRGIPKVSIYRYSTYHVDLSLNYKEIAANYKKDRKWRINKARRDGLKVVRNSNCIDCLIDIFRNETEGKIYGIIGWNYEYRIIKDLFHASRKRGVGELLEVRDSEEELLGLCFLLIYKEKIIYVFNASTKLGKKKNCMSFLIDEIFRRYANSKFIFDFESPEVKEVAEFYRRFGSVEVSFPSIAYNGLPLYKKVIKEVRKSLFRLKRTNKIIK